MERIELIERTRVFLFARVFLIGGARRRTTSRQRSAASRAQRREPRPGRKVAPRFNIAALAAPAPLGPSRSPAPSCRRLRATTSAPERIMSKMQLAVPCDQPHYAKLRRRDRLSLGSGGKLMPTFHAIAGPDATPDYPVVRKIGPADLKDALARGIDDFWAIPTSLIFLGLIYPIVGMCLAGYAVPLLFPLMSGFALVGPFAAIGLYEISRRRELGLEAPGRMLLTCANRRRSPRSWHSAYCRW
jgi:Predicted integral membrane protein (DUF2189)